MTLELRVGRRDVWWYYESSGRLRGPCRTSLDSVSGAAKARSPHFVLLSTQFVKSFYLSHFFFFLFIAEVATLIGPSYKKVIETLDIIKQC